MSPPNSECHARAEEVFAALSTCPKSLRPIREIEAAISSRQKRVGGLWQTGPGLHPQDGFGLPPRSVCSALYSMRQTGSSTGAESRLHQIGNKGRALFRPCLQGSQSGRICLHGALVKTEVTWKHFNILNVKKSTLYLSKSG
jgi:hypothetical protein